MDKELEELIDELKKLEILSHICCSIEIPNKEEVLRDFRKMYNHFDEKLKSLERKKPDWYNRLKTRRDRIIDYREEFLSM